MAYISIISFPHCALFLVAVRRITSTEMSKYLDFDFAADLLLQVPLRVLLEEKMPVKVVK